MMNGKRRNNRIKMEGEEYGEDNKKSYNYLETITDSQKKKRDKIYCF